MHALKKPLVLAGVALASAALLAPIAEAKPKEHTLRFYSVVDRAGFYNSAGKPIDVNPPSTLPSAGDVFDEVDSDFVGREKHHARKATASDHLRCTFTGANAATCELQIAVDGSMLIVNKFGFTLSNYQVLKLSEGTGAFAGDHGTIAITDLANNNANLVIKVS